MERRRLSVLRLLNVAERERGTPPRERRIPVVESQYSQSSSMRNSSIADRDPCPYRIIEDIGGAFAFGAIGGGIWHFGKGAWQSPKGSRLLGAIGNTASRAPVMGGQFAVWGGLFACCDCSLSALRQKVSYSYSV